ncbi:hypothetical protein [Novosphingobium sp. BW1]|uniref:hypothetical protein n=1 Tax=Novosphingobium sp. BW1 TaxID=2592621 RepID=UPI0011DE5DF4|nr:hypothetical protein [Novosphingobium sp. BW1]TYC93046.1 hypothetical protein FMM79_03400 [Novosphingobium sp. BW1]
MRIRATREFIDREADDPKDARVLVGKQLTVTAKRGGQLIALKLAELAEPDGLEKMAAPVAAPSATKGARRANKE